MKIRVGIKILAILIIIVVHLNTIASEYTIVFDEGHFQIKGGQIGTGDLSSNYNKYLAKVVVYKDGEIMKCGESDCEFRGSTLPDSFLLYQYWAYLGHDKSPSDEDLAKLKDTKYSLLDSESWKSAILLPRKNVTYDTYTLFDPLPENFSAETALGMFTTVPVLPSGVYHFNIGYHQKNKCYEPDLNVNINVDSLDYLKLNKVGEREGKPICWHGIPYVPRLLGYLKTDPYTTNHIDQNASFFYAGGFLQTITKNKKHEFKRIANGINIHDGRRNNEYRDSEGCLTIAPDDWEKFYSLLPAPFDWRRDSHQGKVVIRRNASNLSQLKKSMDWLAEFSIPDSIYHKHSPPYPPNNFTIETQAN